jgi:protocatechuate 3,4-dioxygenase beta subunit
MRNEDIKRRELLRRLGALAAVPAFGGLLGCGENGAATNPLITATGGTGGARPIMPATMVMPSGMAAAGSGAPPAMPKPPAMMPPAVPMGTAGSNGAMAMGTGGAPMMPGMSNGAAGAGGMGMIAAADVPWATGGTKMVQDSNYPDPFGSDMSMCTLYPEQTLGPCYAQGPMVRKDISDMLDGLPTRLSLLIVDRDCKPVPNANVDIWHAGSDGNYSAFAMTGMGMICNPTAMSTEGQMFGRGVQMSDEVGRVQFDTVFPGWYRGRTLHIHFTVRIGGQEYTSQLYFEDELVDEILGQGYYEPRGMRDTNNMSDFIFTSGGATPDQVVMETAKRVDGSLHAWKVLALG